MKITIEYNDMISSVEFGEFDIHEFTDHLRGLLHTVWLPEQVIEIMPDEESIRDELAEVRKLGYDEGYKEGKVAGFEDGYADANNAKPAETTEDLQDCIREGKDNAEKSNILCKQDSSNIL